MSDFLRNFVYAGMFPLAIVTWVWLIFAYLVACIG